MPKKLKVDSDLVHPKERDEFPSWIGRWKIVLVDQDDER